MESESSVLSWYALRVRSRCEKSAAADLVRRCFPVCAAVALQRRVWSDRVRLLDLPLFPGYIFARFEPSQRHAVLLGAGVAGIVGCGRTDFPVSDDEIAAILTLISTGETVASAPFLAAGTPVVVRAGPLKGLTGILQYAKTRSRLILSVNALQRSISVEVDTAMVEPLPVPYTALSLRRGVA